MKVLLLSGLCLSIVGAIPQGIAPLAVSQEEIAPLAISPQDIAPQNPDLIEPQYQERQSDDDDYGEYAPPQAVADTQLDFNCTTIECIVNFMGLEPDENGEYTIGDAMFTGEELLWLYGTGDDIERNAKTDAKWPGSGGTKGVIPYEWHSSIKSSHKQLILQQLNRFNQEMSGCLKIKPKTSESNYVRIQSHESGCFSNVGMWGHGMQRLNLAGACGQVVGTIVHEFIHAFGFHHEHVRKDRDQYVQILWENILPRLNDKGVDLNKNNFVIQKGGEIFGPYDGKSVMHYGRTFFTKNGEETIRAKPGVGFSTTDIGQRVWMTPQDKDKLRKMYGCPSQNCKDNVSKCADYKKWGYCTGTSGSAQWVQKNCGKTCNLCVINNCKDNVSKCADYKKWGYCTGTSGSAQWVQKNCGKTCNKCSFRSDDNESNVDEAIRMN